MQTRVADRFLVRVEGRNLVLAGESQAARRHGCSSVRMIEAASADDANELAMLEVWDDSDLRARIDNEEEDPPLLYVSEVQVLSGSETPPADVGEYTFFPEEPIDLGALLGEE